MKKFALAILAVLLLGISFVTAGSLTATSVIIEGVPGESISSTTVVKNDLGVTLPSVKILDVKLVGEKDATKKIPSDMITIIPDEFELEAGEQKVVSVKVDIPQGLPAQIYSGEFTAVTMVAGSPLEVKFDVKVVVSEKQTPAQKPFDFTQIEVDGVDVLGGSQKIHVERGSVVEVRSEFKSNINSDRVRVKVWIGGFEFGDVSDRTGIFTVEPGIVYSKTLALEVPEDIELDADDFRLHVEIFDNEGVSREETFKLAVRKERHSLNLLDVIFFPSNTVEAGRSLRADVRVENLGEQKEEDILVTVSIPELGVSTKEFIDELVPNEDSVTDDDEETSGSASNLVLFIPDDAKTGEYTVEVKIEFNRGHDVLTEQRKILVEGTGAKITTAEALVSVDFTAQDIGKGSEIPYKIMLANLGDSQLVYSIEVSGTEGWATTRTSSPFISVDSDEAGELVLYVKARDDAVAGPKSFTVKVIADGETIKQLNLNANVAERSLARGGFEEVQRGLLVGFVILVVILIILGLVIAFKRVGEKSGTIPEQPEVEGQTYY